MVEQLLDRAYKATYAAKAAGRDAWRTVRNLALPRIRELTHAGNARGL